MKKILTIFLFLLFFSAYSQVGIGTTSPNENAALDVTSDNRGILLPRISLKATNLPDPLNRHINGMLVYNLNTSGSGMFEVTPGLYVNDGRNWIRLADQLLLQGTDKTNDEWVNGRGSVVLGKLSDGISNRPQGSEFVALDNGNVGIGTSIPGDKLTINVEDNHGITLLGGNHQTRTFTFDALANGGQGEINWRKSAGGALAASIRSVGSASYAIKSLVFFTGNDRNFTTDAVERMRISSDGNVGIGTSSPEAYLEIAPDQRRIGLDVQGIKMGVTSGNLGYFTHTHALTIKNTGSNRPLTITSDKGMVYINAKATHPGGMFLQTSEKNRITINATSVGDGYDGISFYDSQEQVSAKFTKDGKLGVGTENPAEKVEIKGALKIGDGGYNFITDNATSPIPTGGAGTIVFFEGHFYGWNGTVWKQLDNNS